MSEETKPYVPDPVDTTSPAAICAGLAAIEDELAYVGNELARAAFWREKLSGQIKLESQIHYADTVGTIPEREAQVTKLLASDNTEWPQKLIRADATFAQYKHRFAELDARRSILQSTLKVHTREQEPRFGEGSHNR